jgi:pimeloyl-ACP methyl ester carboxylesterase
MTITVHTRRSTALLLHGLGGSPLVWAGFTKRTADRFTVTGATLPWALSANSRWSHLGDPVEPIGSALRAAPGGYDLVVAHSFAATSILRLLCENPALMPRALVLVSPFYKRDPDGFDWAWANASMPVFQSVVAEGLAVTSSRLSPTVRTDMARKVCDWVGPYGWLRFFESYLATPFLDLATLTCPTLVVTGATDHAAADAPVLAAALPGGRLAIVENAGHYVMVERPADFAALVSEFVSDTTDPEQA